MFPRSKRCNLSKRLEMNIGKTILCLKNTIFWCLVWAKCSKTWLHFVKISRKVGVNSKTMNKIQGIFTKVQNPRYLKSNSEFEFKYENSFYIFYIVKINFNTNENCKKLFLNLFLQFCMCFFFSWVMYEWVFIWVFVNYLWAF